MNKIPLLVALLVLIAAAGAFLLWNGDEHADAPPRFPETRLEDDSTTAEPIDPFVAAPFGEPSEPPESPAPGGFLEMVRQEVSTESDIRHLVVQVWDGEEGVPAPEADVFVLDVSDGSELTDPFAQHWSDLAERRGQRFRADLRGLVELPPVEEKAVVTARLPGAYGFTRVGPEHRDVETITLHPDETVTVRVVDGEGRTVPDVPVGVIQRIPERVDFDKLVAQLKELEGQMARARAWMEENPGQARRAQPRVQALRRRLAATKTAAARAKETLRDKTPRERKQPQITTRFELRARRRTDRHGIAVFRHFQIDRHEREGWWPAEHTDRFEAVLLVPLQRPERVAFSGRPVPDEILELRLPPTGRIALRTVDLEGRPFTQPVHATLLMQESETVPWARVTVRKEQDEEAIVFPFVGLGLQFIAHCRLDDEDFRWRAPPFSGPIHPGERVTVDLVVAPGEGMLFGRLLDAAGEPLAGVRPAFLISSTAGRLEGEEVSLDENGRFHLPYRVREHHRPPFRLEIRRDEVQPAVGVAMTLPALPRRRVTDLGDLPLDALGRITHGFVVDDRDRPVSGATVQLQRRRDVGGAQPRLEFVDEAFLVARTDAEGRYDLFGELEPGRYRLRAQAKEHFPFESPDLRPGERTDLQLLRKSRLVGTVLAPDWMQSSRIRLRLESATDRQQRRDDQLRDHQGKRYVFFDWVRPGLYDLELRLQDFPDPILRIDRLEILPGQRDIHPRLEDLDLGGYVHRFDILAVDENGRRIQPDRPLLARIARADGRTGVIGFPWKNGHAELLSASPQLEVLPLAAGYVAEPAVLLPGRSEMRFLKIPPLELSVPGLRRLVGTTPAWILAELVSSPVLPGELETWDRRSGRIAGWYGKSRRAVARLDSDDTARLTVMCAGSYRATAFVGGRKERIELGMFDVQLVPGSEPEQVILNADPEQVQAAMTRIAQQQGTSGSGR